MRSLLLAVLSVVVVVAAVLSPTSPMNMSAASAAPQSANPSANPTPVYRFYKTDGSHFFTNNESEKNQVIATAPAYHYEGIAFYSQPAQTSSTQPVYRFYNFLQGVHFYTINYSEYQNVLNTAAWTFRYEGVAYYADPTQVADTTAVYRFHKFTQGVHFYTSNKGESDNLRATAAGEYRYEGVAYYLPTQLTFSGTGTGVTDSFVLPHGLSRFATTYTGSGNFISELKDASTGAYTASVSNDLDTASSSTAEGFVEGRYVIQVTAPTGSPWTIAITQPVESAGLVSNFSGSGNQTTQLFTTLAGAKTFHYSVTDPSNSNFFVYLYDASGNYVDLIANEIGTANGESFEVTGLANYMMTVVSDGSWTLSIT